MEGKGQREMANNFAKKYLHDFFLSSFESGRAVIFSFEVLSARRVLFFRFVKCSLGNRLRAKYTVDVFPCKFPKSLYTKWFDFFSSSFSWKRLLVPLLLDSTTLF